VRQVTNLDICSRWEQLIFVILESSTVCGSPHVIFNSERTAESGLVTMRLWVRVLFTGAMFSTASYFQTPPPPPPAPQLPPVSTSALIHCAVTVAVRRLSSVFSLKSLYTLVISTVYRPLIKTRRREEFLQDNITG